MGSIRWKLVFMYLILVFIVMLISGTFIIIRLDNQEKSKAEYELKNCASYIDEQIVAEYDTPEDFQYGFETLFMRQTSMRSIQASILDNTGTTIASTVSSDSSQFQQYKNSVVISALSGKESFDTSKAGSDINSQVKKWLAYGLPVFDESSQVKYIIYVQTDADTIMESLQQTTRTIVISVFLALALTAILGLIFAATITNPIVTLTKKANLLASGNLEQHVIVNGNDEIGQLTRTFNHMARELRKTVSEMENENNKLEIVLHNMTDGVVAFDETGTVIHANKVCTDLLGINVAKININDFLQLIKVKRRDIRGNKAKEVTLFSNDKYINVSIIPYTGKNKSVEGIVAVLSDITKLRKLDDMRKEFVANVSHEIRTPITNIKSYTETLLDGAIDDRETAIDFLGEINDAADRMKVLTDDLLQLSHLDGKKIKFKFQTENLYELVSSCARQNAISAAKKNQTINFLQPKEDFTVYVDAVRISQVLNNIISNSIKYSGEGARIDIDIKSDKSNYYVNISDNGIGIPKEDLERIFERFYRVDKARSRAMGGNGLGLSIAKEMMEGHKGTITATSKVGEGTTMTVVIPKA